MVISTRADFSNGVFFYESCNLLWDSVPSLLFFKSGNREMDRERVLAVFGWMWRVGDLRSLQNLNYLLALLQPASVSR